MKLKFLSLFLVIILGLVTYFKPTFATAPVNSLSDIEQKTIPELFRYFSDYYGANYRDFYSTGKCESGFNPNKIGDNNRAHNVMQIHKGTFDQWSKEMGEVLDYNSTFDHIKVSAWAFAQGETYRRAWTAYRALKNGGIYSFHSNLLEKDFTSVCNYGI